MMDIESLINSLREVVFWEVGVHLMKYNYLTSMLIIILHATFALHSVSKREFWSRTQTWRSKPLMMWCLALEGRWRWRGRWRGTEPDTPSSPPTTRFGENRCWKVRERGKRVSLGEQEARQQGRPAAAAVQSQTYRQQKQQQQQQYNIGRGGGRSSAPLQQWRCWGSCLLYTSPSPRD